MNRISTILWMGVTCVLGLLAMAPTYAQVTLTQQAPKIAEIVVRGNKSLNREGIVSASGLKIGQSLTRQDLDNAVRNLISTGNFGGALIDRPEDAVRVSADVDPRTNDAKVIIEVVENDIVKAINISGTGPFQAKDVLALLQTKKDSVLNLNTLRNDIAAIQKYYADKGYQVAVKPDSFGMTNGVLDIPLELGVIRSIKVVGLHKTRNRVVLRELYDQKSKDYYNINKLQRAYTRIFNTDLFSDIKPVISTPEPGKVDITLNMEEKRTGNVGVSVGYSIQSKLIGRAELGESNLFGLGQQANLMWETGGIAHQNSFQLDFTEPWLDKKHTSLGISLFDRVVYRFSQTLNGVSGFPESNTSNTYFERHSGGQITISRPIKETVRLYSTLRLDHVRVPSISLDVNNAALLQNGPLSSLSFKAANNTRDYDQDPVMGGYDSFGVEIGRASLRPVLVNGQIPTDGVYGELNYTKWTLDVRRYFNTKGRRKTIKEKRTVLATRLLFGLSTGTLPYSEQFFVGGAETNRGLRESRYWGNTMALGSVELRHPLANQLTGVFFVDAGGAWGGAYREVNINGYTQKSDAFMGLGFGIGMRVVTPIGPIRIDEGFGRDGPRTFLSIGHVF